MIETYEQLIKWLLYTTLPEFKLKREIRVGIIGDTDISEDLSPDFRMELIQLLEHEIVDG